MPASYYDDDQNPGSSIVTNGIISRATPAAVKASISSAGHSAVRFSAAHTIHHAGSGSTVSFRRGQTAIVDNATKAALIAAGAPVTVP